MSLLYIDTIYICSIYNTIDILFNNLLILVLETSLEKIMNRIVLIFSLKFKKKIVKIKYF